MKRKSIEAHSDVVNYLIFNIISFEQSYVKQGGGQVKNNSVNYSPIIVIKLSSHNGHNRTEQ